MLIDFVGHHRSGGVVASIDADYLEHPDLSVPDGDPGGDAGGGVEPPTNDIPLDDVTGQPVTTRSEADEDDDEDDDDAGQEYATEREKRLANALKKAKKRASKTRPLAQRIRDLEREGVTLDDLVFAHRNYSGITEAARNNPRLRALINGETSTDDAPRDKTTAPAAKAAEAFTFDDSPEALGFDPKESKANQVLADAIRDARESKWQYERLRQQLDPVAETVTRTEAQRVRDQKARIDHEWTTASNAALAMVKDDGVRDVLSDALLLARTEPSAQRMGPKALIAHYLTKLEAGGHITAREAKSATTAAATATAATTTGAQRTAARIANNVTQLPRQNAAGNPAPVRNARETLADVRRRLTRPAR